MAWFEEHCGIETSDELWLEEQKLLDSLLFVTVVVEGMIMRHILNSPTNLLDNITFLKFKASL